VSIRKGNEAEEQAKCYLMKHGLQWIQSHYRSRFGEIDLIMRDRSELVFVEVKYRKSAAFGLAYESVSTHKQKKLQLTALQYLAHTASNDRTIARFDVVSLQGEPAQIEWIKNAFWMS
jgi:putative endonuclease